MNANTVIECPTPAQQRRANVVARRAGYGRATTVVIGDRDTVLEHTPYGYRKLSTGEYVTSAYRSNFGWKNTYYQNAETTVMIAQP